MGQCGVERDLVIPHGSPPVGVSASGELIWSQPANQIWRSISGVGELANPASNLSEPSQTNAKPRERVQWRNCIGGVLLAVALLACLASISAQIHRSSRDQHGEGSTSANPDAPYERLDATLSRAPITPFAIQYAKLNITTVESAAVETATARLRLRQNPGLSLLLHAAALEGLDMPLPGYPGSTAVTLRELLLDSRASHVYFKGDPIFVVSPWGLQHNTQILSRQEWQTGRQAHAGQLLNEFARHGLPLHERLRTNRGDFQVKDLVRDVMANLSLSDAELEWSAIALILYLPPQNSWVSKFGNPNSFSDLAEELMRRTANLERRPCYGIHCLEALALFLKVDEIHHVLSPPCKTSIYDYLSRQVAHLSETQDSDGSWPVAWHLNRAQYAISDSPEPERPNIHNRVHVTGHHVGWMLLLPVELLPPDEVFANAANFLLRALRSAEDKDLLANYCPYSHAACSLRLMMSKERR
jgi:hypothetical protein